MSSPATKLVGGWTNPFEKYARQIGFIFPKVRDESKKIFELPPARKDLGHGLLARSPERTWDPTTAGQLMIADFAHIPPPCSRESRSQHEWWDQRTCCRRAAPWRCKTTRWCAVPATLARPCGSPREHCNGAKTAENLQEGSTPATELASYWPLQRRWPKKAQRLLKIWPSLSSGPELHVYNLELRTSNFF